MNIHRSESDFNCNIIKTLPFLSQISIAVKYRLKFFYLFSFETFRDKYKIILGVERKYFIRHLNCFGTFLFP